MDTDHVPRRYEDRLIVKLTHVGMGVVIPLIVNIIMLAYTYGGLTAQVRALSTDITKQDETIKELRQQINNLATIQAASARQVVPVFVPQSDATVPQQPAKH